MPHYEMIYHNISITPNNLGMLQSIDATTDVGSHLVFNCYYSFFSVIDPNTYANLFKDNALIFNILYGLGYMYTDV